MIDIKRVDLDTIASGIIIGDIGNTIKYLQSKIPKHYIRLIGNENGLFNVELSKNVIKESLITSYEKKFIIMYGKQFREEALNALLKSLEEPPLNIIFIIIVNNKASILPTVISRMSLFYLKELSNNRKAIDKLDYRNIDDKAVINLLLKHKRISRDEVKTIIQDIIVLDALNNYRTFDLQSLEQMTKYLNLLNLNSNAMNIFTALLMLLNKSKKINI